MDSIQLMPVAIAAILSLPGNRWGEEISISRSHFLFGPFLRRYLKGKSNCFLQWMAIKD